MAYGLSLMAYSLSIQAIRHKLGMRPEESLVAVGHRWHRSQPYTNVGAAQDQRRECEGDQIAAGPIKERTPQPGAQRSADANSDCRIAENRSKSFAGKDIGSERRENDRPRAEANAKENDIDVE